MNSQWSEKNIYFLAFVFLVIAYSCVPVSPPASGSSAGSPDGSTFLYAQATYKDRVFHKDVRSVRLYPDFGEQTTDLLRPVVIETGKTEHSIILKFDMLYDDYSAYELEIIHCDKDWKKSRLQPLDYMMEYNRIPLREYEYSFDTKVPFTHYFVRIPPVKVSGNYAIAVFPKDRKEEPLFIKRFMVYEDRAVVQATLSQSSDVMQRRENHQIDLKLNYSRLPIVNPQQEVFVHIRQNQRWDNVIENLSPNFLREDLKELEYRYFDLENNFKAGNEFRFFDISMRNFRGLNVKHIVEKDDIIEAYLNSTRSKGNEAYSFWEDFNGSYIIQNKERGGGVLDADYFDVHFELKAEKISEPVFIMGELTNWEMGEENLMTYNAEKGAYEATLLLKQGFYNYIYYVDSDSRPYYFEGSHFETENRYEIFVYYREQGARYDRLIGYRTFRTNRQN